MRATVLSALFLAACGTSPAPEAAPNHAEAPAPAEAEVASAVVDGWETFGEPVSLTDVTLAKTLLDDPMAHVGDTLLVEGEVADVCQKAGCWMVVSDGARTMRVIMKDHAFSVAKDGTGATARIQGEVTAKGVDPETIAHYKSESAKPDAMPEANLPEGAEVTYELVASAVQLRR